MVGDSEMPESRSAFESWYSGNNPKCKSIERNEGRYVLMQTYISWQAWAKAWNTRAALSAPDWQPIETAPKGNPSDNVGCRDASDWFLGRRKDNDVRKIRRRAWPQEEGWMDKDETYYTTSWFTHWMPLPEKND